MSDYAVERTLRLEKDGVQPYMEWKERSIVSVSENAKTYKAYVAEGLKSAVFQVDGEIIKAGAKCDKYLAALDTKKDNQKGVAVFIELKGKDISHML